MKKKLVVILCFLLACFNIKYADDTVCANINFFALEPGASSSSVGVARMECTAGEFNISPTSVGLGMFTSNQVLNDLLANLISISDGEKVVVIDGAHTVFTANCMDIINVFDSFDKRFVISASRCHPSVEDVEHFKAGDAVFSYLNGGAFMGYVSETKKIISRLVKLSLKHPTFTINQLFNLDYSKHKDEYKIDKHALLFLDTAGISEENGDVTISNGAPYVTTHLHDAEGSNPLIIHSEGNGGGGDEVVHDVADVFGCNEIN